MRRPEFIARQSGRPHGWLGRLQAWIMERETAAANQAALTQLALQPTDQLLEIGFGPARTLERAAQRLTQGRAVGVDHAPAMVDAARRRCTDLIAAGRVEVHCADSARLPFADASFDKALSVNTLYFWHPPGPHLREIRRTLRPGGCVMLAYRPAGARGTTDFPASVYRFYSPTDVHALLADAGFTAIDTQGVSPELQLTTARAPAPQEVT
ncbi:MAG: class I SAM-dependent methyltransferase [Candidatus Binatia bacterium]